MFSLKPNHVGGHSVGYRNLIDDEYRDITNEGKLANQSETQQLFLPKQNTNVPFSLLLVKSTYPDPETLPVCLKEFCPSAYFGDIINDHPSVTEPKQRHREHGRPSAQFRKKIPSRQQRESSGSVSWPAEGVFRRNCICHFLDSKATLLQRLAGEAPSSLDLNPQLLLLSGDFSATQKLHNFKRWPWIKTRMAFQLLAHSCLLSNTPCGAQFRDLNEN